MSALIGWGIVLMLVWAVLYFGLHAVGWFVNALIILGAVLLIWGLIKRGTRAAP